MESFRQQYPALRRHPLVVCATLVENPMNLGALCRTTEAFRLEALVLRERALANHRQFRQLAVATHPWQPLLECSLAQLPPWLQQQRQRGYSLVALACDERADALPRATLAEKMVLLLGREQTGIPPHLLSLCDRRLVIPQYGMVDSLNVQTAAAIAIYEYIRQWGMTGDHAGRD